MPTPMTPLATRLIFMSLAALREGALWQLPDQLELWFSHPLPCSRGKFSFLDPSTEFFSFCFTAIVEGALSALFIVPIAVGVASLWSHARGTRTLKGHLSYLLALAVPALRLTSFYLAGTTPSPAESLTLAVGLLVALSHWVQDGRVLVCGAELLLYWSALAVTSGATAIEAVLRATQGAGHTHEPVETLKKHHATSWPVAIVLSAVFLAHIAILYLETRSRTTKRLGFDSVTIFDKISLGFLDGLLKRGQTTQIVRDDFPAPPTGLNAVTTHARLRDAIEASKGKWRVILSLLYILRKDVALLVILDLLSEVFSYLRPPALSLFLKSLQGYINGTTPIFQSLYFGVAVGVLPLFVSALQNIFALYSNQIYLVSRSSLTGMIYRKSLALSPKARETYDSAKIMNLLNVDTDQIDGMAGQLPNLVSAPTSIVLATWQLYLFIGPSMFASIPIYIIFTAYSSWSSKVLYTLFPALMEIRDARTKATSDAVRNIKSLKLYAWENPFKQKILDIRDNQELTMQRRQLRVFSVLASLWTITGDVVAAVIFIAFLYYRQGVLSPDVVFPCLSLLSYVTFPFMAIPQVITALGRAMASQTRINEFLEEPELVQSVQRMPPVSGVHATTVKADGVEVSWNGETTENLVALRDINLVATNGDLVCITGRVGSGKTALLKSLIGETILLKGDLSVSGSISYCPQEPWLQNKTIKENILFGKKWDPEFYAQTLAACALDIDIKALPEQDETEVGERGVSLSGGQKARVALARAVYARSDVYVLDDVLSAVDEHVSSHLIEHLLGKNGLIASATIVLATNNVKVLSHASRIVALKDKTIAEQLTVEEVLKNKDSLTYSLIADFGKVEDLKYDDRKAHIADSAAPTRRSSVDETTTEVAKPSDEDKDNGTVSLLIFKRYFESASRGSVALCVAILVSSVLIMNSISIWLGIISNHSFSSLEGAKGYILVYVTIAVFSGFSVFLSQFYFMGYVAISVSRHLHAAMLSSVLRSPMRFFDVTPLGKILNRFTGDVQKLDQTLPPMLYYFVRSSLNLVVQLATVLVGAPLVVLIIIPLSILGNSYRKLYIPASRQLQRMSSAANSPMLSHIEESVKGAAVVRAFDRVDQFIQVYESRCDYWIDVNCVSLNMRRWLSWRIQGMTAALSLSAALSMVVLVYFKWLGVGLVGVVMYNATRSGVMVQQIIAMWADLEVSGVALDRALEYIELEQEAPEVIDDAQVVPEWPQEGRIKFSEFSARYAPDSQDVLKKLSFSIGANEKIGIVGRTGSGKSTVTLALFRLLEASGGAIDIDNVTTSHLGLRDLRSQLSIIPQDSQIFGGTLRENLDPFGAHPDDRLWDVLALCSLREHVESLGTGLETKLSDGGDNLSRGQTQLICLARALLRNSKILVLDEATASVDVETDKIVQSTIRTQFKDCTIVTIAHRLNTIMDSDRILVLNAGELVEFDAPQELIKQKGAFYKLTQSQKDE